MQNFGIVKEAFVSYCRETGRPRGFGFVVFESPQVCGARIHMVSMPTSYLQCKHTRLSVSTLDLASPTNSQIVKQPRAGAQVQLVSARMI